MTQTLTFAFITIERAHADFTRPFPFYVTHPRQIYQRRRLPEHGHLFIAAASTPPCESESRRFGELGFVAPDWRRCGGSSVVEILKRWKLRIMANTWIGEQFWFVKHSFTFQYVQFEKPSCIWLLTFPKLNSSIGVRRPMRECNLFERIFIDKLNSLWKMFFNLVRPERERERRPNIVNVISINVCNGKVIVTFRDSGQAYSIS